MSKNRKKPESIEEARSGALNRNNVYSADAVRDWAWRIRSGPGGVKMNEKFTLIAMATSVNPRGVCELPVRYIADHIGVGMRQAQRIIVRLIRYDLVIPIDLEPEGRPNDMVRTFKLNTTIDADTWTPGKAEVPLMRHYRDRLRLEVVANRLADSDHLLLLSAYVLGVRSKRLEFVSPDREVTNAVFHYKKLITEIVSEWLPAMSTKVEILKFHMIPKKGYRG